MPNYLTYPFRTMRITQRYDGTTSHLPHMTGTPKDYPIDEAGLDGGRDPVYAKCDLVVRRVWGVGNGGVNTVWLESTEPVKLANGKTDDITLMLTHPNDSDVKRLKAGMVIKKGAYICYEGSDGATGNHIHMSVGLGKMAGNGWTQNTNGKWVLTTTGGTLKPEDAFFIDPAFTTVKDAKGLKFKTLPAAKPTPGKYRVTSNTLNVRQGTSTKTAVKCVLGKGATAEITKVKTGLDGQTWGKIDGKGWVCMAYVEKVSG